MESLNLQQKCNFNWQSFQIPQALTLLLGKVILNVFAATKCYTVILAKKSCVAKIIAFSANQIDLDFHDGIYIPKSDFPNQIGFLPNPMHLLILCI